MPDFPPEFGGTVWAGAIADNPGPWLVSGFLWLHAYVDGRFCCFVSFDVDLRCRPQRKSLMEVMDGLEAMVLREYM